jgi:hypothetical protein
MGTLQQYLCTFVTIPHRILLRMRSVSYISCTEHQTTHFRFNIIFSENRAHYVIVWKYMIEPDRSQITV